MLAFVDLAECIISRVCLTSNGKFRNTTHFHYSTFWTSNINAVSVMPYEEIVLKHGLCGRKTNKIIVMYLSLLWLYTTDKI